MELTRVFRRLPQDFHKCAKFDTGAQDELRRGLASVPGATIGKMSETIALRDTRTSFLYVSRALLDRVLVRLPVADRQRALSAYTALAYFSRETGCNAGIEQLAAIVGISPRTMRRALADLARLKAIRVRPRTGAKGTSLPNEYALVDLGKRYRGEEKPRQTQRAAQTASQEKTQPATTGAKV